jgi:hypothetical protein
LREEFLTPSGLDWMIVRYFGVHDESKDGHTLVRGLVMS